MSAPVDVLAVMKEAAELGIYFPTDCDMTDAQRAAMREARAAVAELIEAARDVGMNRLHENPDEFSRSLDRLDAALARVGGAA